MESQMNSAVMSPVKNFWERASCGTTRTERSKYSRAYFQEVEDHRYRHEPFIHSFAQFSRWHGQDILEVGVGAGTDFAQFVRAGANATGVDWTDEAIGNVRERLKLEGLEAADLQARNAESLPYEDDRFALVYSWGVIHHAENMEKVFDEIYRVTKPGGTIKIMVYNINSLFAWYRYVRHALLRGRLLRSRSWVLQHFQESYGTKAYSRRGIQRLMAAYPHEDLRFYFWDQKIRDGARWERARRLVQHLTPQSMRWYMPFEFRKKG